MPTTKSVSAHIHINASQQATFEAVTNWDMQRQWIFATKVKGLGTASHQLGGTLEAFTGIGRVGFMDTMTITKWDPPKLCEVTHTGNVVKGRGLFAVTQDGDNCSFTWTEFLDIPAGLIGIIGWGLVSPFVRLGLAVSLRRFRKLL